jgi:hypothetical protein
VEIALRALQADIRHLAARDLQISCNLPAPEDALTVMEIVDANLAGGGHVEYPEPFVALY